MSSKIRLRWNIVAFIIDCKAKNVLYNGFGSFFSDVLMNFCQNVLIFTDFPLAKHSEKNVHEPASTCAKPYLKLNVFRNALLYNIEGVFWGDNTFIALGFQSCEYI